MAKETPGSFLFQHDKMCHYLLFTEELKAIDTFLLNASQSTSVNPYDTQLCRALIQTLLASAPAYLLTVGRMDTLQLLPSFYPPLHQPQQSVTH